MRASLVLALLVACDSAPDALVVDAALDAYALPPLPAEQPCRFEGQAPGALPRVEAEDTGRRFARPVAALGLADGRVVVAERAGRVVTEAGDVVFDLTAVVQLDEAAPGLTSLAERPGTGELYAMYGVGGGRAAVAKLGPGGAEVLFDGPADGGGQVLFDRDGGLYVVFGDRAGAGGVDPQSAAGTVLRVDLDSGQQATWARGLRDPWRCDVGPSGALWCGDVGPDDFDEITVVNNGQHHGWPHMVGRACRAEGCEPERYAAPLHTVQRRAEGCGVTGGVHYAGAAEALRGALLYSDRCDGTLHGMRTTRVGVSEIAVVGRLPVGVTHLGRDADGELLAVDEASGGLYRLRVPPPQPGFPARLSEAGCFEDLPGLRPAPGVVPFEVNSPLWTDGAVKDRHLALPPGARVERVDGEWRFPEGAVLLKSFSFPRGGVVRPVETRVMVRRELEWAFHTYRWNDEGTDAELLADSETVDLQIDGDRLQYLYPDRAGCGVCHGSSGRVLGPSDIQLARGPQLAEMARVGVIADAEVALTPLADPADESLPLEDRARAWLHANCSHCHRPGGWTPPGLGIDFRATTPLAEAGFCGERLRY